MIETGEYLVAFYNRYGGRLRNKESICTTFTGSVAKGRKVVAKSKGGKNHRACSFTVSRRLFNSLDNETTWE